jgi:hypothetical protein
MDRVETSAGAGGGGGFGSVGSKGGKGKKGKGRGKDHTPLSRFRKLLDRTVKESVGKTKVESARSFVAALALVSKESGKERQKQKREGKKDGGEYGFLASLLRDATPPASPVMSAMAATTPVPAMAVAESLGEGAGEENGEAEKQQGQGTKKRRKVSACVCKLALVAMVASCRFVRALTVDPPPPHVNLWSVQKKKKKGKGKTAEGVGSNQAEDAAKEAPALTRGVSWGEDDVLEFEEEGMWSKKKKKWAAQVKTAMEHGDHLADIDTD